MFREMRRKKQALSEEECIDILIKEPRGVLAVLGDNDYPYAVPLSHVYVVKTIKDRDTKIEKLTHLGNKFFPSEEETKSEIDRLLDVTELYEITIEHMSGKIVEEK